MKKLFIALLLCLIPIISSAEDQYIELDCTGENINKFIYALILGSEEQLGTEALTDIYLQAREIAEKKGIIIADTKFEFGRFREDLILIDELLTPDSSRFWARSTYVPGKGQDSYDKQIVRDYLLTLDWDKTYPGPQLPEDIVDEASKRYHEILEILTG